MDLSVFCDPCYHLPADEAPFEKGFQAGVKAYEDAWNSQDAESDSSESPQDAEFRHAGLCGKKDGAFTWGECLGFIKNAVEQEREMTCAFLEERLGRYGAKLGKKIVDGFHFGEDE